MKILVTAGNTQVMIDRVRCITNIFSGRTGAQIAREAWSRGHHVRLLTSHPDTAKELGIPAKAAASWGVQSYRTFVDLHDALAATIRAESWDAVVHAAAVADYLPRGAFELQIGSAFVAEPGQLVGTGPCILLDRTAGKIKSDAEELWLRLVKAPKLIDLFRGDWGFRGILVKFKLEVGVSDAELLRIAERSRQQSKADLMVANTLDTAHEWAHLGAGDYKRVPRGELPARLLGAIERLHNERILE